MWKTVDFVEPRQELSGQIDAIIREVDTKQEQGRTHNNQQLEDIAFNQTEANQIKSNLITNLVTTTETITKVEKENFGFIRDLEEKNTYKHNIRSQINEIQHLMRLLNLEVSQQEATYQKVQYTVDKENDLQARKDQEEEKMVGMIVNDIAAQSKSLNSHLTILKASE